MGARVNYAFTSEDFNNFEEFVLGAERLDSER